MPPLPRTARRAVLLALAAFASAAMFATAPAPAQTAKPTIVLVHGAFADASGWNAVTARLQKRGYPVLAPANPLRGIASDAAYLRSFLSTVKGPIVLVGHSYGGAVITNAATGNANVKALVYIAAYAPDQGETILGLSAAHPGGQIGPPTLDILPFPLPDGTAGQEAIIKPAVFHDVFAADLPDRTAAVMAASQRPAALAGFAEPSGVPAWRSIRSWYLVPGKDNAIGTALERFMARRMNATTVEVRGASHVVMISHPQETERLILRAAGDPAGRSGRGRGSHTTSR